MGIVLKLNNFLRNTNISELCNNLSYFVMSSHTISNAANIPEEDISLRAQRKKKAQAHYRKKFKVKENKRVHAEATGETEYYFENGLRKVYPYYYNFTTYAKGRWYGRTILDVFTNEFKGETEEKYREEIEKGRLTVNGNKISPDHILGNNELLEHTLHRHENPVKATPIQIIADTPDVLVINKPPSIPCHPCGRYRYNSLTFILDKEYGYKNLRTLYRLDRLTSGVLIFPKNMQSSKRMERQQADKKFKKEYLSRVEGKFPEGSVDCNEPLGQLSHKVSIYCVDPKGKDSRTTFTRLSYNGKTSVVSCLLHTGRTHQIRVHLQYLGYPVVNDPLYNSTAFGPEKGKGGVFDKQADEIEELVMKVHNTGVWKIGDNPLYAARIAQKKTVRTPEYTDSTNTDNTKGDQADESDKVMNTDKTVICDPGKEHVDDDLDVCNSGSEKKTLQKCEEPESKKLKLTNENDTSVELTSTPEDDSQKESCNMPAESDSETSKDDKHSDKQMECSDVTAEVIHETTVKQSAEYDENKVDIDELCKECKYLYMEPKPSELLLYLHAYKYTGPGFEYSTEMPDWAREDWVDTNVDNV